MHWKSKLLRFGLPVATTAFFIVLHHLVPSFTGSTYFIFLYPSVVICSWWGGFVSGLLATSLGLVGANFFLMGPEVGFVIPPAPIAFRFVVFAVMGTMISYLNGLSLRARAALHRQVLKRNESDRRLRVALQGGGAHLWEWRASDGMLWRSENHHQILGLAANRPRMTIAEFREFVHPEDRDRIREAHRAALADEVPYDTEFRLLGADGVLRWVKSSGQVVRDAEGRATGMAGAATDISDLKRLQADLESAKEHAEAASEAKSQFVSYLSHEMRSPLGVIVGFTDLALESAPEGGEQADYLHRVRRSAEVLLALIGNVLDLSKVEARKLTLESLEFSPREMVREVLEDASLRAREKGVRLTSQFSRAVPSRVISDPTRVRQILTNLVGNSLKFTEDGQVGVEVSVREVDAGHVLEFRVIDSGIGISPEQRDRLFQSFQQAEQATTRKYGGTGLGLVLSRELAKLLGGDLTLVRSEARQGSTFAVTIELRLPEGERLDLADGNAAAPTVPSGRELEGCRVLVIDDSVDNRWLVGRFLASAGARVDAAENGGRGIEMACSDSYDVILTDIQMPVVDGFLVTRTLRERGLQVPILALTANAMLEEKQTALESGFNGYITKPLSRAELIARIQGARSMASDDSVMSATFRSLNP